MGSIEWSPNRGPFEEPHSMNKVISITRKPVIDALWKGYEIPSFDVNANPRVLEIANVKVAATSKHKTNFFRVMDVLLEE